MVAEQEQTGDLLSRPTGKAVLESLAREDVGEGGAGVLTSRFYRHFILERGNKEMAANLRFRRRLIETCRDNWARKLVWTMCSRDILFWVNAFGWTYDPRNRGSAKSRGLRKLPKTIPFITWPYQDDALLELQWCVENGVDGMIEKSRDMGASWIFLTLFDWYFLFQEMDTFLMVSRKEDLVDKNDDPDSLFWKIDYLHKCMPKWMLPGITRQKLHFKNEALGCTIDGESTTGDVGRGGRRTAIGLDEFGAVPPDESFAVLNSTNDTTDCRIFNSTPKGIGNAYYEQTKRLDILRIRMHWVQHPGKNEGLYFCEKGKCPIHAEGGKPHSKWYDRECERRGWNTTAIAQELDIDYSMSGGVFFNPHVIEAHVAQNCRYRRFSGELDFDGALGVGHGFLPREGGNLQLWVQPGMDNGVPVGEYAIGCDIAEGTGASYSCLSLGDCRTGEKIGEYSNPLLKPYEFARLAVSLARMFVDNEGNGAKLIWEANGPGREFGDEVTEKLKYENVWRRVDFITQKRSNYPGWVSTQDEKIALFGAYRRALTENNFINRSRHALNETCHYQTDENGVPTYHGDGRDLQRIGQSHGDIVIADCLLNKVFEEHRALEMSEREVEDEPVAESSMGARFDEAQAHDKQEIRFFSWAGR